MTDAVAPVAVMIDAMKKTVHINIIFLLLFVPFVRIGAQSISETKNDYSVVARKIAGNCDTKQGQAEAIYKWLCLNIAYDTEHKVHTADECWSERKGVCQAYCELFYRLGEPLGLKCTMIPGVTKNSDGVISDQGHAWLLVEVEDGGILIDPTWGAGGTKDGTFIRSDNDMQWFDVDPYWMIFTHHPDDSTFQFIDEPIDREAFVTLPYLKPTLGSYGWDGKSFYTKYRNGELTSLPLIYSVHAKDLYIKDVPLQAELDPGQYYTFKIAKRTSSTMALVHDGEFVYQDRWHDEDSCYTICYMPVAAGPLRIMVARPDGNYSTAIEYTVLPPTAQALEQIKRENPYRSPQVKSLENLHPELLEALGIDGNRLLDEIARNNLKALPILHKDAPRMLKAVDVPLSQYLTVGHTYRFAIHPAEASRWAIFNEGDYYNAWTVDESTGWHVIEVCPMKPGRLSVSMGLPPDMKKYRAVLTYTVR